MKFPDRVNLIKDTKDHCSCNKENQDGVENKADPHSHCVVALSMFRCMPGSLCIPCFKQPVHLLEG